MKQMLACMAALLLIMPSALALYVPETESVNGVQREPYYIYHHNALVKGLFDVRHDFSIAFSADITPRELMMLHERGIKTEPVSIFYIGTACRNDKDCDSGYYCDKTNAVRGVGACQPANGGSEPDPDPEPIVRSCYPSTQTPWGIKRVYNDNSIESTSGGSGVVVAVLDTGVMTTHEDLKNRVMECHTTVTRFPPDAKSCEDAHGHGTHVAGTILADGGQDGRGIYGVAPEAKLISIKVCDRKGSCYGDDIAAGITLAADRGAQIISMSLGGSSMSTLEKNAIDYAVDKGVLIIASAGNSGPNLNTIGYPAAYFKVVSVAATDVNDRVADFSSRGIYATEFGYEDRYLEVAAPGVSIESAFYDGCYRVWSGTSMAAPHVSGLAAKQWAGNTPLTRAMLQESAQDITSGHHTIAGYDPASGFGLPVVV
jgi:subtilisin family serine protease